MVFFLVYLVSSHDLSLSVEVGLESSFESSFGIWNLDGNLTVGLGLGGRLDWLIFALMAHGPGPWLLELLIFGVSVMGHGLIEL